MSALILSLVNGLMLLRNYLSDRPRLFVNPIHPDVYQWFFPLPKGEYQDQQTRKYGFLVYFAVGNRGLRDVSLESWRLHLKTVRGKWVELKPLSIPEPQIELGQSGSSKVYPVLGQKGPYFQGDIMIKAGSSVSGFAYYIAEFYGGRAWEPSIKEGKAIGRIEVQSVFGKKAQSKIFFTEIPLEKARTMIMDIDKIDLAESTAPNSDTNGAAKT